MHLIYYGIISKNIDINSVCTFFENTYLENLSSDFYLELASTSNPNRILEILNNKIYFDFNQNKVRNLILSFYNSYFKNFPEKAVDIQKKLIQYQNLIIYENSNQKCDDFLYGLVVDYNLKKDGFSGSINISKYLQENLNEYHEYDYLQEILSAMKLVGYKL